MRKHRADDATVWIGYADFLTTLALLFLVLIGAMAAKTGNAAPAEADLAVLNADGASAGAGCLVEITNDVTGTTNTVGRVRLSVSHLYGDVRVEVKAKCPERPATSKLVGLRSGKTTYDTLRIGRANVVFEPLAGDHLFEPNEYRLKPGGRDEIIKRGREILSSLGPGLVVAVQGHTDDVPFPRGADKDNWMLSGERAASVAAVLTNAVGIPECQVTIMGFGPSRPAVRRSPADTPRELARKRAQNRRIEFKVLEGIESGSGSC